MVKPHNVSVAGRNYLDIFNGYSTFKGYRRKRLERAKALKKMLPGQSGPISPEEIGNGPGTKDPAAAGNGSTWYKGGACPIGPRSLDAYLNDPRVNEFLSTERSGRRNALTTGALDHQAETETTIELPDRFDKLSMETDQSNNERQDSSSPGTSKQQG